MSALSVMDSGRAGEPARRDERRLACLACEPARHSVGDGDTPQHPSRAARHSSPRTLFPFLPSLSPASDLSFSLKLYTLFCPTRSSLSIRRQARRRRSTGRHPRARAARPSRRPSSHVSGFPSVYLGISWYNMQKIII